MATATQNLRKLTHSRETAPAAYRAWFEEQTDQFQRLELEFQDWLAAVGRSEILFETHVYENKDIQELDLRRHRGLLYALLESGERIACRFLEVGSALDRSAEAASFVTLVDQKLAQLLQVLFEWHGPLEGQQDIPDSFKAAMREASQNNLVEFP